MECPNCSKETSDMASTCEWCGALIQGQAQPPYPARQVPAQQGFPPAQYGSAPPPGGSTPPAPGTSGAFTAPGDASNYGLGQPAPPSGRPPSNPWYYSPLPYLIAVVLVLAIIGGVVVMSKRTPTVSQTGQTFADFVVNGKPTLVDFYTYT